MAIKDGQPRYILTPTELAAVVNKSLPAITKSFKDQSIRLMARRSGLPPDHVREYLEKEGADYSFRVISHLNLRGGCSKQRLLFPSLHARNSMATASAS